MRQFSQTGLRTQAESPHETYKRTSQDRRKKQTKKKKRRAEGCEGYQ